MALIAGKRAVEAPMPAGQGFGRALGRDVLDDILLDAARSNGAFVHQTFRVKSLRQESGGHHLTISSSSEEMVLFAPVVIAAHGSCERGALPTHLSKTTAPSDMLGLKVLPLVETNAWWIRYAGFPRLQLAVALLVLMAVFVVLYRRMGRSGWAAILLAALALAYHAWHLYPYSRTVDPVAVSMRSCDPGSSLHIMIANVQKRNEQAEEFLELVAEVDPDVLLVMETDDWWSVGRQRS